MSSIDWITDRGQGRITASIESVCDGLHLEVVADLVGGGGKCSGTQLVGVQDHWGK